MEESKMKSKNMIKIIVIPITCLLFTPTLVVAIADLSHVTPENTPDYALDFAAPRSGWYGPDMFEEITYFSFYTFFKSGIDPDCIDMIDESKRLMNNVQV